MRCHMWPYLAVDVAPAEGSVSRARVQVVVEVLRRVGLAVAGVLQDSAGPCRTLQVDAAGVLAI